VETIDVAGSFRRKKETVGDIDILVISDEPEQVMDHFVAYDQTETVYGKGKTKSSIRLTSGIQIDLRVVPKENYGAALLYFTGSKAHNIALRRRAQERGWTINEYRVSDGEHTLASRTEEEIFQKLELSYISPELREDRGEIEAAASDSLPGLIERDEMHGDLHCHTTWSDGSNSIEEMADAAEQLGYQYVGITDHSQRLTVAHGLTPERLRKQIQEIDHFNEKAKIRILKGLEVDILEDGRLDMPDDVLRRLDYTVCSVHSKLDLPQEKQTKRMITAMQNPLCTIIGHPTGRIIGRRREMDLDMKAILREAAKTNTVMEINAQPDRLDLKDQYILYGREIGIRFVISTDAHSTRNMAYMQYGTNIARRGWLSNNNVINTLPVQKIHSVLASKRG
jgi:DNA polymerase (family 10)